MSTTKDGGPAFPHEPYSADARRWSDGGPGMSLRDYFAGQALSGLCQGARGSGYNKAELSRYAFAVADAMLAAREKGGAK